LDIIFHPFSCVPHIICGKIHNVTICFRFLISGYKMQRTIPLHYSQVH
jgi:hypothetical protein